MYQVSMLQRFYVSQLPKVVTSLVQLGLALSYFFLLFIAPPSVWSQGSFKEPLKMSFVGDIMAHDSNYQMQNLSKIYLRILPLLRNTQLNFGNLEFVIDDESRYSTYPTFNVHKEYVQAAITAGFNIFSLANNHSADFGLSGIRATAKSAAQLQREYPALRFSGLRNSSQKTNRFQMESIDYNGWHIGFTALSILSNSSKGVQALQYIAANDSERLNDFYSWLEQQRANFDLVVLSVHGGVEYQLQPSKQKQMIFRQLAKHGGDIVWGHHPHVQQPWEIYKHNRSEQRSWSFIMYSQGNFISAQTIRTKSNEANSFWAATGDSVLLQLELQQAANGSLQILELKPFPLTTIRLKPFAFGVVPMQNAAAEIRKQGYKGWEHFYAERQKLLEQRIAQWPQVQLPAPPYPNKDPIP